MNIAAAIHAIARRQPDHPALIWEGGTLGYGALDDQVARIAGGLRNRHGLRPGQRVALAMENCPEFLPCLLAIWRAGLTAVPVNAKLHPKEFAWIFENARTPLVIANPKLAGALEPGPEIIATGSPDYASLLAADPAASSDARPEDPAWIFYTSGTTGRPKGAVLTFRNLLAMSLAYLADADFIGSQDIRLHAAPMSHGSGLYALPFLLKGAQHLIPPAGFDPGYIYDALASRRDVSLFAAPTMVTRLLADDRAGGDTAGLKTLEYGGAPMYVSDCKRALEAFGPTLYQLYGQGESPMTISHVTKAMHADADHPAYDAILGSVGCARTGCEIAIVDDDWQPLPSGSIGEIATRSDCVMAGYLDNPEATDKAVRGGWLKTGDVGVIDETGILTIKDRSKDMIISGGSNIYPREIEEVLLTSEMVHEAAVIGLPHADWGEEVVAVIVAPGGVAPDADTLENLCLNNLARFKRPKRFEFVESLPKNNYGKIVKSTLRDRLGG